MLTFAWNFKWYDYVYECKETDSGRSRFVACCGLCAGEKEGYVIEGEIAGIQTGTVYLKCYRNGAFEEVDSAAIENGKFTFKGTSDEPLAYALTTVKENKRPQVFF